MVKIVEYGTYIIDLADAMIDHQQGLNSQHISRLSIIRDRSVRFVTSCIQHENADLETLYSYLNGDAMQLIMIVISYSDFLMMDESLHPAYRDAVNRMKECGFAIRDELKQMKDDLIAFMSKIGMAIPVISANDGKKSIQRLQPKSALQVDYLSDEPLPPPPEPVKQPIQRLQPRNTMQQATQQKPIRRLQHAQAVSSSKIRRLQPQH